VGPSRAEGERILACQHADAGAAGPHGAVVREHRDKLLAGDGFDLVDHAEYHARVDDVAVHASRAVHRVVHAVADMASSTSMTRSRRSKHVIEKRLEPDDLAGDARPQQVRVQPLRLGDDDRG